MQLIENLKWRYATKKMDSTKKVADQDILKIKEAIQLAASSYGLQAFKVIDVVDTDLRQKLQPACWNQSQIVDASHLFIFCNQLNVSDQDVDDIIKLKAEISQVEPDQYAGYGDFVKMKLKEKSENEMLNWTAKQTYIALANALVACAELKIDSTPMEGFEADKVNNILELHAQNLNASLILAIGFRSEADASQHNKKVRKPLADLFEVR